MDRRRSELFEISSYIRNIDNEVTLILQSLQWDRKNLLEGPLLACCKYDHNHRIPPDIKSRHEEGCQLKSLGYTADDLLLPEPVDANANTLVTLNKNDISQIIECAAKVDPLFQKGRGAAPSEPLTLGRLQLAYSRDERRALHDAVAAAAPAGHGLADLALPGGSGSGSGAQAPRARSRAAALAELRDMKRRRTKYRVAAKTRNFSDVLRDVIATQMEHISGVPPSQIKSNPKISHSQDNTFKTKEANNSQRYDEVRVKKEPVEDKHYAKDYVHRTRYKSQDRSKEMHKERDKEKRYDDYYKRDKHRVERDRHSSSSKGRSRDRKDRRSSDRYRRDDRESREHTEHPTNKRSRNSEGRHRREYDSHRKSHREEEHRRYYDYKEDEFEAIKKRIKQEQD